MMQDLNILHLEEARSLLFEYAPDDERINTFEDSGVECANLFHDKSNSNN